MAGIGLGGDGQPGAPSLNSILAALVNKYGRSLANEMGTQPLDHSGDEAMARFLGLKAAAPTVVPPMHPMSPLARQAGLY